MPLNPKIAQVLAMIARAKRTPYSLQTPPQARAAYEKSAPLLDVLPAPLFSVEDLTVPVRDGNVIRARLYCPVAICASTIFGMRPLRVWRRFSPCTS